MSVQEFAIRDVHGIAGELLAERTIIAIIPASGEFEWGAEAAWKIARAAANTGRRTALIDLNLENPILHHGAQAPRDTGIVDAFLFGASLKHVASPEAKTNLHFIGVGTAPGDPDEVWTSDRWQRLARGFEKEGAILVLFLAQEALASLSITPDLLVAVSRRGFGTDGPRSPEIRQKVEEGLTLVVVRDVPEPSPPPAAEPEPEELSEPAPVVPTTRPSRRMGPLKIALISVLGVVVTAFVAASVLFLTRTESSENSESPAAVDSIASRAPDTSGLRPDTQLADSASEENSTVAQDESPPPDTVAQPEQVAADSVSQPEEVTATVDTATRVEPEVVVEQPVEPSDEQPPQDPIPEPPPERPRPLVAEPLTHSVQVAAWTTLGRALDHVEQFHRAGHATTIAVVPRDSTGLWYRVIVGAVASRQAALELRERLRSERLIGRSRGIIANTPYALLLARHPDLDAGQTALRGLRESGIPAYIVSMPDGSAQILVGAYESPGHAEMADSVFPESGRDLSRILVSRVGIAR